MPTWRGGGHAPTVPQPPVWMAPRCFSLGFCRSEPKIYILNWGFLFVWFSFSVWCVFPYFCRRLEALGLQAQHGT